jgi:hypothetical protein
MYEGQAMNYGSVAFLDVLGFKGIWKRHSPSEILERLELLQVAFRQMLPRTIKILPDGYLTIESKASFLSDTFIMGAWRSSYVHPEFAPLADLNCLLYVILAANTVQHVSVMKEPYFVYRGCITSGEFMMSQLSDFVVGPAVDEAATNERLAQGPFIWLSDKSTKILTDLENSIWFKEVFEETYPGQIPVIDHPVLLRDGTASSRKVVLPLTNIPVGPPLLRVRDQFLSAFTPPTEDVLQKRKYAEILLEETIRFLEKNPLRL